MAHDIALLYQKCNPTESLPPNDPRYVPCENVRGEGNGFARALTKQDYYEALRQIDSSKQLTGGEHDEMLLSYLHVLEYQNGDIWYAVNPAVRELKKFQR